MEYDIAMRKENLVERLDVEAPLCARRIARPQIVTTIHIRPDQHERLSAFADRADCTRASLIRRAIDLLLAEECLLAPGDVQRDAPLARRGDG